jgi:hypothetical protein
VRRRYLIAGPRPFLAAPLAVHRRYLALVLRPVFRPLPAETRLCRIRLDRGAQGGGQNAARGHATLLQQENGTRQIRGQFLSQILGRGAKAVARGAVRCALQVLDRGAEAVTRGSARCASHVLDRGA